MKLSRGHTAYAWHGPIDGPVVVLVHGLTTPSFVWEDILPDLTQADLRVLTYDHYGRGNSAAPFGRQDLAFFESHLIELLEHLQITSPVRLVGYSMGGGIVADFAAKHPDRVARVALIAPIGFDVELGWANRFAQLPVIGDALMAMLGPARFRNGAVEESKLDGTSERMTRLQCDATRTKGFARSVLSSLRHVINVLLSETHRKIVTKGTPVCAIWGQDDPVIPLSGAVKLEACNPSVKTHIIPHGRHGITYTHADQVGPILARFLG